MGTQITMFATGTGGAESALASIDVPMTGTLETVDWAVGCDLDADTETFNAQLSFGSTYSGTNDSRQIISHLHMRGDILTAVGAVPCHENKQYVKNIRVAAGERIYLHASATAGVASNLTCIIGFSFDVPGSRR